MSGMIFRSILIFFIGISASNAYANPILNFSDLISGPDTGLGDGKGSGVIVTVWGQNLGSIQGNSSIEYCDSTSTCRSGYVYYWKNADGKLPGGPANLYESHRMQEIAFSIPDSAAGAGTIKVTVNGMESTLPFTVRPGGIYHVKSSGTGTGDGSWSKPFATVDGFLENTGAGDTAYLHDIDEGEFGKYRTWYDNRGVKATDANHFAFVAYPGERPINRGQQNIQFYNSSGLVTSKITVYSSNCRDESLKDCPVENKSDGIIPGAWGRVIGNEVTDIPGGYCATGQSGAISGGGANIEGAKIFGNYIHDYGCPNTSKLHHTTYFTIRDNSGDRQIKAWEIGWNYLKDNHPKMGIHNYDENSGSGSECGDMTTDLLIHDNVIVDQGGAGISEGAGCWTQDTYIYNNVLIRTGKASDVDCTSNCGQSGAGIFLGGGSGDDYVYNNIIYNWDPDNLSNQGESTACIYLKSRDVSTHHINDNICYNDRDEYFVTGNGVDFAVGNNNIWYFAGSGSPSNMKVPGWDSGAIISDPLLTLSGSRVSVHHGSLAIGKSSTSLQRDIYGMARLPGAEIGAVEFILRPKPPSNITVQQN
jgi:hypothetical protein